MWLMLIFVNSLIIYPQKTNHKIICIILFIFYNYIINKFTIGYLDTAAAGVQVLMHWSIKRVHLVYIHKVPSWN